MIIIIFELKLKKKIKGGFREFSKTFPHFCVQKQKVNISCPISYDNSEETFKYAIENAKMSKIMDHIYLGMSAFVKNKFYNKINKNRK
jgi:hypothetical protein